MSMLFVAAITALAYWQRDRVLYALAGFACLLYGFDYWATSATGSILLAILGIYSFIRAWLDKGKVAK